MEGHARLRGGLLERVEIHHHHVDGDDAVLSHRGLMGRVVADVQDAAVHLGVQRLDAAIEHFGKSGQLRDVLHGESSLAQRAGGAAGRNQFHTVAGERAGKFDQAGLVSDAEQSAADGLQSRLLRGFGFRLRLCLSFTVMNFFVAPRWVYWRR